MACAQRSSLDRSSIGCAATLDTGGSAGAAIAVVASWSTDGRGARTPDSDLVAGSGRDALLAEPELDSGELGSRGSVCFATSSACSGDASAGGGLAIGASVSFWSNPDIATEDGILFCADSHSMPRVRTSGQPSPEVLANASDLVTLSDETEDDGAAPDRTGEE